MKKVITRSEFDSYSQILSEGITTEISVGDSGHIDGHEKIAAVLSYFPNRVSSSLRKTGDNEWAASEGGVTGTIDDQTAEGFINMSRDIDGLFMVLPDNYISAMESPVGSKVMILQDPRQTYLTIESSLSVVAQLQSEYHDLKSRLEALEATNPE